MSYEGYEQQLCENGHLRIIDAWFSEEAMNCICGAKIVWRNGVDDTNCDAIGYIEMNQFLIKEATQQACEHCGHITKGEPAIYRIPTLEETKRAQTYWDGEEHHPLSELEQRVCEWKKIPEIEQC